MAAITVWGRNNSVNVQKVMWTAAELGLETERIDTGGAFGGNDTPEYLAMNPTGRIPMLRHGEVVIWESNVCVRYLADVFGRGSLMPDDPSERAACERWMDWQLGTLMQPMTVAFWQLIRTPEAERDTAAITRAEQSCAAAWTMIDRYLEARDFLELDRLTVADIPLAATAYRWYNLAINRPKLASVERWYAGLSARPGFTAEVMVPLT